MRKGIGAVALALFAAASSAEAGSYIYAWGTWPSGSSDVYSAAVTGPGSIAGWNAEPQLPQAIRESWGAVDASYLYIAGGPTTADVYSSPIGGGGSLGGWTVQSPMPMAMYQPFMAWDASGFLHTIGGATATIYSASAGGGSVGGWGANGATPGTWMEHAGAQDAGYAYVIDGSNVYSAPVSGGSVGGWSAQTPLPVQALAASAAIACGNLYVSGVGGGFGGPGSDVYQAPVSAGAVGSWTQVTSMPVAVYEHVLIAVNDCGTCDLYVLGGYPSSGVCISDVYTAPVLGGGALGSWSAQPFLPIGMCEIAGSVAPGSCAPSTTPTPTRTQTPTRTPTSPPAPGGTPVPTPTCNVPIANVTPPYLLVDRNSFSPEHGPLQVIWAVLDPGLVQITIFDSAGEYVRRIAFESCGEGRPYRALWDGTNDKGKTVSSNVYILRLVQLGSTKAIERRVAVLRQGG